MAKFCKKCGNQLNDNAMFCPKCGTKFEAQPIQQPAQNAAPVKQPEAPKKKKSHVKAIIAVILAIAIFAGGGFAFWKFDPFSLFGKGEETSETDGKNEKNEDIEGKDGKKDSEENGKEDKTESEAGGEDDKDNPSGNGGADDKVSVGDIGSYVTFGKYEQDNDTSNGKEDIEWLVLAKENGKALLISKYELDCKKYNEEYASVTWETCTLRTWLNGTFINDAFSSLEQSKILTTTVTADKNSERDTDPGNDTNDKIFLLSESEANKYFPLDVKQRCAPTAYAIAQGAYADSGFQTANGDPACSWWLRTPGGDSSTACIFDFGGVISNNGDYVHCSYSGVRPALWVNL